MRKKGSCPEPPRWRKKKRAPDRTNFSFSNILGVKKDKKQNPAREKAGNSQNRRRNACQS